RVTYVLLAFLLTSLVLFSGCFSKVKEIDKISGPSWVTSLTMPLVTRVMEKDDNGNPRSHSEIRLGKEKNGIGEDGLDLAGRSFSSYKFESVNQKWEKRLDTINVDLETIQAIDLNNPIPKEVTISSNEHGVEVNLTDTGLAGARLSNKKGTHNAINITLTNGQAGLGGLRFFLKNYEGGVAGADISRAELSEGESTKSLDLAGETLPPRMYLTVEGDVQATAANAGIAFTGSTLEIVAVKVDENKLADLYQLESTVNLGEIDLGKELGEDRPTITLDKANLEIMHDLPDSLQVTANLKLEGRDKSGGTAGSFDNLRVDLRGKGTANIELKDELNEILNSPASALAFKLADFKVSPAGGEAEIELGTTFKLEVVSTEIGFGTITTKAERMEVPEEIKNNPLQTFIMNLEVTNTSPAGFDLTLYLSPDPEPVQDPNAVKVEFSVPAANGGVPGATNKTITVGTDQLNYLTQGSAFYNQIRFTNKSGTGVIEEGHYIEIRAWARVDILMKKKEAN
ncbi:MAG: hypothetical protein GX085_08800, partial [Firmicutes bacterium]|nr:hypothetical protein [Bacillota bacterium]